MRGRWSVGVVVAIAVAVAVALSSQAHSKPRAHAASPAMHVTLAFESDGVSLSVTRGQFVVTLAI